MRCIEMHLQGRFGVYLLLYNRYMRCIEIYDTAGANLQIYQYNRYMRCIEILVGELAIGIIKGITDT